MGAKILFVAGGSYVSGLEIATLHIIKELKTRGFDIRCIVNGWNDGVFIKKLEELSVPYDQVKLGWVYWRNPRWTLDSLIHYPAAFLKARRIIKTFGPDAFHFCAYSALLLLYPLIKVPCVYNLQEPHVNNSKHGRIYKWLNRKVQYFVSVSNYITGVLKNLDIPEKKIRLIYNGVPAVNIKHDNRFTGSVTIFAIIGQVVPWKGHTTLLKAVERLKAKGIAGFCISVYGNDKNDYALTLKQQIDEKELKNYFDWKGFVTDQDGMYRNVQAVIVPSLSQEPCSLTIIESMMNGKAVIVSDRGGNPELVEHDKTGLVFAAENAEALGEQMEYLIQNKEQFAVLANNAHIKAVTWLTISRMGTEYEQLYNELTNTKN
jgi:glycosyltransferase involved in cell wall biosynthesis